ncbi:MAG: metallophosphoesterase [Akkermansiaceae bacterium]|nr:metallophosphoesterase [Armatimonadota bacterium]
MALRQFLYLCPLLMAFAATGCSDPTKSTNRRKPVVFPSSGKKSITKIAALEKVVSPPGTFFTTPYLQLGTNATDPGTLSVVWHTAAASAVSLPRWVVETRSPAGSGGWKKQVAPIRSNRVAVGSVKPHVVYTAAVNGLVPGEPFDYRVLKSDTPVFAARANRARPSASQDYRMVLFGDCAEDTAWQKKIAYQTSLLKPDAVLLTGDIVYPHGRASEYRANYFPVYGAEKADPERGAPLLASTLFIGVSGNHDLAYSSLSKYPDGMAYYYYWKQPLNGWGGDVSAERPPISGDRTAFEKAAGESFPVGGNFTFDYGNTHFVAIDANYYMNWQSPKMVAGLRKAVTENPSATWRFVVLHVPPFHSSAVHQNEQWMRRLAPLFEETGVDVVWSGHVHNYQRSRPLHFLPSETKTSDGKVDGTFALDTVFDGVGVTKPDGVLYVVTGAGGAALYSKPLTSNADSPEAEPFTAKYDATVHSLTELTVRGKTLSVRQVDENGKEVDRWSVTK